MISFVSSGFSDFPSWEIILAVHRCTAGNRAIAYAKSLEITLRGFTAAYLCKVLESADRCEADRTSDRVGAGRESVVARLPAGYHRVSTKVSAKKRWRGRALPTVLPRGRGSRSAGDPIPRLSRSGRQPLPAQS